MPWFLKQYLHFLSDLIINVYISNSLLIQTSRYNTRIDHEQKCAKNAVRTRYVHVGMAISNKHECVFCERLLMVQMTNSFLVLKCYICVYITINWHMQWLYGASTCISVSLIGSRGSNVFAVLSSSSLWATLRMS